MTLDTNWQGATSATAATDARYSFPTPSGNLTPGAGLQRFQAYVRKTAGTPNPTLTGYLYESGGQVGSALFTSTSISSTTGQLVQGTWDAGDLSAISGADVEFRLVSAVGTSTGTETLAPDTLAASTNLTGAVTAIDEAVDSPDANWLTATSATAATAARTTFPSPAGDLNTGAGLQKFRLWLRKTTGTPNPTADVDLYENGSLVANLSSGTSITSTTGQLLEPTWNASLLAAVSGVNVELRVAGNPGTAPGTVPAYQSSSAAIAASANNTALNVTCPATVNANDILILLLWKDVNTTLSENSGTWTAFGDVVQVSTTFSARLFWKRADGTEDGATVACTAGAAGGSNNVFGGVIHRFSGCKTTGDPFEGYATPVILDAQSSGTGPSVVASADNRLGLQVWAIGDNLTSAPSGGSWAEANEQVSGTGNDSAIALDTAEIDTTTATGAGRNWGANNPFACFGLALVPPDSAVNTVEVGAVEWVADRSVPVNTVEIGAINWIADYVVSVALDSGAVTAAGADLPLSLAVSLDSASAAVASNSLTILEARTITLDSGAAATNSSELTLSLSVTLDSAAAAAAGTDVSADLAVVLDAGATGAAGADLSPDVAVALDSAAVTVASSDLTAATAVSSDTGAVAGAGSDLTAATAVLLDTGAGTITGEDVTPQTASSVILDSGTVAAAGSDLTAATAIQLDTGAGTVAGEDVTPLVGSTVVLDSGAVSVAGSDVTPSAPGTTIVLDSGSVAVAGSNLTPLAPTTIQLSAGIVAPASSNLTIRTSAALASGAVSASGINLPLITGIPLDLGSVAANGNDLTPVFEPPLDYVLLDSATAALGSQSLTIIQEGAGSVETGQLFGVMFSTGQAFACVFANQSRFVVEFTEQTQFEAA